MPARFTPGRERELDRGRSFVWFAAVLFAIAGLLDWRGVQVWPWCVAGTGALVLSQALFKWILARWVICDHCHEGYTYVGIVRREDRQGSNP